MKKLTSGICAVIGSSVFALLLFACQDFFELGEESITPKGLEGLSATTIQFDNRNGSTGVNIYDDNSRSETSGVTSVGAGQLSKKMDWQPGMSNFYVSYDISISGIPIVYVPQTNNGIFQAQIAANDNTEIKAPPISDYVFSTTEALITNKYYLSIHNTGSSGYSLLKGSTLIKDTTENEMINAGRTGVYEIKSSGDYKVSYGSIEYPLSNVITPQNGYVYFLTINAGGIHQGNNAVLINLQNNGTAVVPGPDTGSGYIMLPSGNVWKDDRIEPGESKTYRFGVERGKSYYIQWNDSYNGDRTKTADVMVAAYFSVEPNLTANRQTTLFSEEDNGWTQARPITALNNGYVFVTVRGYSYGSSGTFAVRYYANN
ncbi:MAG: hypothetical protein LBG76_02495 [Treponema sp.]|nr:hypothetical protein [Treponema sp.]